MRVGEAVALPSCFPYSHAVDRVFRITEHFDIHERNVVHFGGFLEGLFKCNYDGADFSFLIGGCWGRR